MGTRVSIIIPTHSDKRWDSLARTIRSAAAQDHPVAEIIVVVDHNPALQSRVRAEFPAVGVLANRHERGASGTRNTGAEHATGEFVAFLDDDTAACPGWLAEMLTPFSDPVVVGAGGGIDGAWSGPRPRWMPTQGGPPPLG